MYLSYIRREQLTFSFLLKLTVWFKNMDILMVELLKFMLDQKLKLNGNGLLLGLTKHEYFIQSHISSTRRLDHCFKK